MIPQTVEVIYVNEIERDEKQRNLYYVKIKDKVSNKVFWKIGIESKPHSRWSSNSGYFTSEYIWTLRGSNDKICSLEKFFKDKYETGVDTEGTCFEHISGGTESLDYDFIEESIEEIINIIGLVYNNTRVVLDKLLSESRSKKFLSLVEVICYFLPEEDSIFTWKMYHEARKGGLPLPSNEWEFKNLYGGRPWDIEKAVKYVGKEPLIRELLENGQDPEIIKQYAWQSDSAELLNAFQKLD